MNSKGFTLIELLAAIAILAILMLMAVPNVIGVVTRNKNKTYVEDAKKLVSLTEYKVRSNAIYKPATGTSYCFYLSALGATELEKAPNGGEYDSLKTYVKVTNQSGQYKYFVQLVEKKEAELIGIAETSSDNLYQDNFSGLVKKSGFINCSGYQSFN